nr:ADP/ATP translocase 3-like [Onthophagus taurus]
MNEKVKSFLFDFGVSGSAAVVSKTLIAPVERAKFIIQNQDYALDVMTGKQKPYSGLIDLFTRIPKEQGILSLWRGNGTNIARYFPSQALNFSLYNTYKNFFTSCVSGDHYMNLLMCKLFAGGLAGACSAALVFPLDFCQTRLALDMGHGKHKAGSTPTANQKTKPREFNGMFSCFYKISQKDGVLGLYRGVHLSVIGFGIYRAFYFALYEMSKLLYHDKHYKTNSNDKSEKMPLLLSLLSAQICTIAAGMASYPLDTMARHMMLDAGRPMNLRKNKTMVITAQRIWKKYGIYGFFRGAFVNAMRCTAGALVLVMYDEFVYYTYKWKMIKK